MTTKRIYYPEKPTAGGWDWDPRNGPDPRANATYGYEDISGTPHHLVKPAPKAMDKCDEWDFNHPPLEVKPSQFGYDEVMAMCESGGMPIPTIGKGYVAGASICIGDPHNPPGGLHITSERARLLEDGARLTDGPRNVEYGEPIENLTMTGELKAVFHKHMKRHMGPAEKEAIDMVLTKLGRLGRGAIKRDTYMDAAVYMAIAYEVALLESQS